MANFNYFAFTARDIDDNLAGGELSSPVYNTNASAPAPIGELCQPNEIIKLSPGSNYSDIDDYIEFSYFEDIITVYGTTENDWNSVNSDGITLKTEVFTNWMKHIGLESFIDHPVYTEFLTTFENENGFQKLSGPSVAYVTRNADTLEVSLGLNSYDYDFWTRWLDSHKTNQYVTEIRKKLKTRPHFISQVAKIQYSNTTAYTYSFDARHYTEYTGDGVNSSSIEEGGGNYFTEIKFAGTHYAIDNNLETYFSKAKYILKKNVDPRDPTYGLCSGYDKPFCVGDLIHVIDVSIVNTRSYTGTNNGFEWTWIGTPSDVDRKWYIANVTRPCTDYANATIYSQLFPLRVISECKFEDFN